MSEKRMSEFVKEVTRGIEHSYSDETKTCVNCKKEYVNNSWDFYSLCGECFIEFDSQKMKGRFSIFGGERIPYFESVNEWIASKK